VAKDQEQLESLIDEDEIEEDDDDVEVDDEDIVLDDDLDVDDDLDADLDDEVAVLDDEDADDDEDTKGTSDDEDEDDEDTEASLDEILAERAKAELVVVDDDDDDDDLLELVSDDTKGVTPLRAKITPVKEKQEFVCARCHLVKNRAQMADPKRGLCRDCV
jgi:hypothetical protein